MFKIKKSVLLIFISFFLLGASNKTDSLPFDLIGEYQLEELGFYRDLVKIVYQQGHFYIAESKDWEWGDLQEVQPVSKADMEKLLNNPVDYPFSGLANDNVALFKVPEGWKAGKFVCNTGYWVMTLVGPLEVIKK